MRDEKDAEIDRLHDEYWALRAERNILNGLWMAARKENEKLTALLNDALRNRQGWEERADAAITEAEGK